MPIGAVSSGAAGEPQGAVKSRPSGPLNFAIPRRRSLHPLSYGLCVPLGRGFAGCERSVGHKLLGEGRHRLSRVAAKLVGNPPEKGTPRLSIIGTTSSGTLIVLFGTYVLHTGSPMPM